MTNKAITSDQIEGLEETEKKAARKLSKTARQKRRADLANPSTISIRLSSMLAEAFPPEEIIEKIKELMTAEVVTKGGQVRPDTPLINFPIESLAPCLAVHDRKAGYDASDASPSRKNGIGG
jgi:hypothetical protein